MMQNERYCGARPRGLLAHRLAWLLICVAGVSHCGRAQTSTAAFSSTDARREAVRPVRGLLWQLRHGRGEAHVLGVLPSAHPGVFPLDARIEQAFDAADVLALEVWVPPAEQAQAAEALVQAGRSMEGTSLAESLSPGALELLRAAVPSHVERAVLERFQPWFVALSLRAAALDRLAVVNNALRLEEYFVQRASGKRVVGLVPRELPVQILTSLGPELAEEELVHTLRELPSLKRRLRDAARAWSAGHIELAAEALGGPQASERSPGLIAALVTERRRAITEGLLRLLGEPASAFVLLELTELSGPGSVLEQLEQAQVAVQKL